MIAEMIPPQPGQAYRHGHVLTLSGNWGAWDLVRMDASLKELSDALPRTTNPKRVTLHLMNFALQAEVVEIALSLVKRRLPASHITTKVVAEGRLGAAGLLFLAASQSGHRKAFMDLRSSLNLTATMPGEIKPSPPLDTQDNSRPTSLRLLPPAWQRELLKGETLCPDALTLNNVGLVDKLLPRL